MSLSLQFRLSRPRNFIFIFFILCFLVSCPPGGNFCEASFWNNKENNNDDNHNDNIEDPAQEEKEKETFVPDPNDKCEILDTNGNDVTSKFYDYQQKLVNCTGEHVCQNYQATNCGGVLCKGMQACYEMKFYNVTNKVRCLGKKPCMHAEIHAVAAAVTAVDDDEGRDDGTHSKVDVDCIGRGACDVTTMTNVNDVICDGVESCRKTRIHASSVSCNNGSPGQQLRACGHGATIIFKKCLICGNHNGCGTAINHCRYNQLEEGDDDEILSPQYWSNENNWATFQAREKWTKCKSNSILGDQCHPKWKEQFEEDQLKEKLENSAGQDSEGEGI